MVTVLFYIFAGFVAVQIFYYLGIFGNFAFLNPKKIKNTSLSGTPSVSLIICAKNEAENLRKNLPAFLSQNHPDFEIILINDSSYDDTLEVMEEFAERYPKIRIVNVAENETFWGKKKYALTLGIKVTRYDHLVFTDADCTPASNSWLTEMAAKFSDEKTIVLGYGGYIKVKNSLLNKLIRFETVLTAMQYFSMARVKLAYMGVGRNLAYHKSEFIKHNGFANHMHIRSGDDDLFVNEAATPTNIDICFSPESFTYSEAEKTFKNWYNQKRRHVSTAKYYQKKHKLALGFFYLSQLMFWVLAIIVGCLQYQPVWVLSLVGARFIIVYFVFGYTMPKLKETKLLWLLPFYESFLICVQLCIFISNSISKPKAWK